MLSSAAFNFHDKQFFPIFIHFQSLIFILIIFARQLEFLHENHPSFFQLLEKHRFLPVAGFNADDLKSRLGLKKRKEIPVYRGNNLCRT